jgi:hypothetical protein
LRETNQTLRWDYRRGKWRCYLNGVAREYWLTNCADCGTQAVLGKSTNWCNDCSVKHSRRLHAVAGPAQRAVRLAIIEGRLPRLDGSVKCKDCGKPAQVYDHREYAKPLEVDPVCRRCNCKRGPAKETRQIISMRPGAGESLLVCAVLRRAPLTETRGQGNRSPGAVHL